MRHWSDDRCRMAVWRFITKVIPLVFPQVQQRPILVEVMAVEFLSRTTTGLADEREALRRPAIIAGRQPGFTLVEVMVVVVIVGILASVALPAYSDYVIRGKIPDATSVLSTKRVQLEQFFMDNRTYVGAPSCTDDATSSQYFDFSCTAQTATAFTLQAAGKGTMAGFNYTIDQAAAKTSAITASGWAAESTSCWITKKGGAC